MKKALRSLVVACASLAALAFAGSAMAAYTSPTLLVKGGLATGGSGPSTISVSQSRTDDATFRIVIYVPQGYRHGLIHPAGTTIGTVTARAQAGPTSDVILPLEGNILAADPVPYRTNPVARGCVGTGTTIDGVWILRLTVSGQTLDVPVYLTNVMSGPEAAFASGKLTVCLASPYVPEAQGGARFGAKLISASLRITADVFANPSTRGTFTWTSVWTPWTVGTGVPNPPGTVETQSRVRIPAQATLNVRRLRGNRLAIFGGVSENRVGVAGARVTIRATGARRFAFSVRTNARGLYSRTVRITRRGTYRLSMTARVADRTLGQAACTRMATAGTTLACVNATAGGFTLTRARSIRWR